MIKYGSPCPGSELGKGGGYLLTPRTNPDGMVGMIDQCTISVLILDNLSYILDQLRCDRTLAISFELYFLCEQTERRHYRFLSAA